jgi:hypothetical protein
VPGGVGSAKAVIARNVMECLLNMLRWWWKTSDLACDQVTY